MDEYNPPQWREPLCHSSIDQEASWILNTASISFRNCAAVQLGYSLPSPRPSISGRIFTSSFLLGKNIYFKPSPASTRSAEVIYRPQNTSHHGASMWVSLDRIGFSYMRRAYASPLYGVVWASGGIEYIASNEIQQLLISQVEMSVRWALPPLKHVRWYQSICDKCLPPSASSSLQTSSSSPIDSPNVETQNSKAAWLRRLLTEANLGAIVCKYNTNYATNKSEWDMSYVQELGDQIFIGCGVTQSNSSSTKLKLATAFAIKPLGSLMHVQLSKIGAKTSLSTKIEKKLHNKCSLFGTLTLSHDRYQTLFNGASAKIGVGIILSDSLLF